jgi:hypothetical protein
VIKISTYQNHGTRIVTITHDLVPDRSVEGPAAAILWLGKCVNVYMKLFCRFLNTSILHATIIYKNNTRKRIIISHSEFSYLRDAFRGMQTLQIAKCWVDIRQITNCPAKQKASSQYFTRWEEPKAWECFVFQKHVKRKGFVYWCDVRFVGHSVKCFDCNAKLNL